MNSLGNFLVVTSGIEILTSHYAEQSACFYYCLARSDCNNVEYDWYGTCILYEIVNDMITIVNPGYEVFEKHCDGKINFKYFF